MRLAMSVLDLLVWLLALALGGPLSWKGGLAQLVPHKTSNDRYLDPCKAGE